VASVVGGWSILKECKSLLWKQLGEVCLAHPERMHIPKGCIDLLWKEVGRAVADSERMHEPAVGRGLGCNPIRFGSGGSVFGISLVVIPSSVSVLVRERMVGCGR